VTVNNPDTGNKVLASTLSTTRGGQQLRAGLLTRAVGQRASAGPGAAITQSANASSAVPAGDRLHRDGHNTGQDPYTGAAVPTRSPNAG